MEETRAKKVLLEGLESDGSEENGPGENMNPLEIPVVVKIIVSYINEVNDLKNFRTLRTCWRDETFKKWRNSAVFLINNETLPVLLKAYSEPNWDDLSKEEKDRIDPFQLRQVPFKRYRFSREQSWAYPLEDIESNKKLIWEKVISPNAIYLDLGECAIKWQRIPDPVKSFQPGLCWVIGHCRNVTDLAMVPVKSEYEIKEEPSVDGVSKSSSLVSLTISESLMDAQCDKIMEKLSLFDRREIQSGMANANSLFELTPNLQIITLGLTNSLQGYSIMQGIYNKDTGQPRVRLRSLNIMKLKKADWFSLLLDEYLELFNKNERPLRELKMSLAFLHCVYNYRDCNGLPYRLVNSLKVVEDELTKLELEIDCELSGELPIKTDLYLKPFYFPNLTHFKVNLDYKSFPGKLLSFNFKDLRGMPSLQEFYFGTKRNFVDKSWINRKLEFPEGFSKNPKRQGVEKLSRLKSFHFHGNFAKQALQQLGRMTENLKTLEVVLDKENFSAVKEIWPGLRNLKLLPCSEVPEEDVKALENSNPSLTVINDSLKYSPC